jgi:predicted  nucleic acid-binding Zn-ribbon protein
MSLVGRLYKLQQLDLELQDKQRELDEAESQLRDNKALAAAQSRFSSQKEQWEVVKKKQRDAEWELEDLQEKIRQIDGKLYSGKTKDPKELVNLEKEVKSLKNQTELKEDALLGLMSQVEEIETEVRSSTEGLEQLKREWEEKQETLGRRKREIETMLVELRGDRSALAQQIDTAILSTYERIKLTKGEAVVKVEKGKCQGCHITVATSQWQKVKAGDLIQCSSCSKILYLE